MTLESINYLLLHLRVPYIRNYAEIQLRYNCGPALRLRFPVTIRNDDCMITCRYRLGGWSDLLHISQSRRTISCPACMSDIATSVRAH